MRPRWNCKLDDEETDNVNKEKEPGVIIQDNLCPERHRSTDI